jgi:SH3-like domain-containing protein
MPGTAAVLRLYLAFGTAAGLVAAHDARAQAPAAPAAQSGASGLPLPRFVSLKSDRVNMRSGPGTDYPTAWILKRVGMPVEILREFEGWRQIRDAEGVTGWVLGTMLSGRRTALIQPWDQKPGQPPAQAELRDDDDARSRVVAVLEAGVLAGVSSCDGRWCKIQVGDHRGHIEQRRLWGVYDGEIVK